MPGRPDPIQFAQWSYLAANISAGILVITFLIGLAPVEAVKPLGQIIWLIIPTGAVGAFLGYAAGADFKKHPGPPEAVKQAQWGFRLNSAIFSLGVLLAVFLVVLNLMAGK
jgi:hypothetical protein